MLNSCVKKLDALSILEKSFIAHGGKKSWSEVSNVAYFKNIKLYDSIGNLEEEITQKIKHTWNPSSTKIEWDKFGDYYVAQLEKEKVTLYKNHQEVLETKQLAEAYVNTKGALYVFWQPSKLLDSQAQLEYIGEATLLDSIPLHALKVTYPSNPSGDIWHYYFNKKSFRLDATQVNHAGRISLIINESVETKTGLFLNKIRKSYFVDSIGKIKYLRAAYDYKITSFN